MISWADKAPLLKGLLTQTTEREREREKKKKTIFRHPAKSTENPTMECQCSNKSHVLQTVFARLEQKVIPQVPSVEDDSDIPRALQ